jgi:hypothetical protein
VPKAKKVILGFFVFIFVGLAVSLRGELLIVE